MRTDEETIEEFRKVFSEMLDLKKMQIRIRNR